MSRLSRVSIPFPTRKRDDVITRLKRMEKQNKALLKRIDELERTLSQQNLILEKLILDRYPGNDVVETDQRHDS